MKKVFALCLAAVMVLALAACGGSAKPAETQAPAAAPAATEAPAAPAKKWIVASDTVFKPFEYTDASGYIVEEGTPDEVINNPKQPRTIDFLSKVL